jgi:CRP-like cAMP-binding protein
LLSPWAYTRVEEAVEQRSLPAGTRLRAIQEQTEEVVFPVSSIVSLSTLDSDGRRVGVALAGDEGAVGAWLALGFGRSPWEAVVRGGGDALVISPELFRMLLRDEPDFRQHMLRYGRVLFDATTQALACRRAHEARARAARWLLELADRSEGGLLATPELIEAMLGEDGTRGTARLDLLTEAGVIEVTDGDIVIVDRGALEAAACSCYRARGERP